MAGTVVPTTIQHRDRGIVRIDVALVCDASDGSVAATSIGQAYGRVVGFLYSGGLDASAVVTIKDRKSGASLIAYTTGTEGTPVFFRPTSVAVTNAGAAITAADTAPNVNRDIYVAGPLTITVASGGNSETATVSLIVDENGIGDLALTV